MVDYSLINTGREIEFDEINELASVLINAPISIITLVDEKKQWIKSCFGVDIKEIPKEFFQYNSEENPNKIAIINNLFSDKKYTKTPFLLNNKSVDFYIRIPIVDKNNFVLGALTLIDYENKEINQKQLRALQILVKSVFRLIESIKLNENKVLQDDENSSRYLALNNSFYLILSPNLEIVDFGKSFKKSFPQIKRSDNFYDYFDSGISIDSIVDSMNDGDSIFKLISSKTDLRFKCSILKLNSKIIISAQPIINENYPIINYNISISDFSKHDYIIEYLFLQQSSIKALSESRTLMDSMSQKKNELEEKQNELKEQKQFYEFILNNIPSDIAVFSPDHKYLFLNPVAIKNTELRNFMIGKDDFDYCEFKGVDSSLAIQRRKIFNEIVANKQFIEWQDDKILDNGNRHITLRKMGPIYDEKGELNLVIGYGVEITSRIIAEENVLLAKKEVERINLNLKNLVEEETTKNLKLSKSLSENEKMATVGELASGIAHDLNTPLGSIKNGAEAVEMTINSTLTDLVWKFSREQINLAIARSLNVPDSEALLGGMLQFRKSQEYKIYLTNKFKKLSETEILELSKAFVKARINIDEESMINEIITGANPLDYLKLIENITTYQLFINSIQLSSLRAAHVVNDLRMNIKDQNAEKSIVNLQENIQSVINIFNFELKKDIELFINVDESINIDAYDVRLFQLWSNIIKNSIEALESKVGEKIIKISSAENLKTIDISIENNGPEIPLEVQNKIFDKFYSTKVGLRSSGIGLSIVNNILTEHNANIVLESSQLFTRFTIQFVK